MNLMCNDGRAWWREGNFRVCKPSLVLRLPNFIHAARTYLDPTITSTRPAALGSIAQDENSAAQSDSD